MSVRLLLIFVIVSFVHKIHAQNDSTVAQYELNRMNNLFGYRIKMNILKEGEIVSLPNEEIQISLEELRQMSESQRKDLRLYIVRFIVAHEFAHQVQYYRYKDNPEFMRDDDVSRTIIEEQADILAGYTFFLLSPELLQYKNSHPQLVEEIFTELFRTTYELGIKENTLGSHPSKRDRMLAVRLGLNCGSSWVYDYLVKSDPSVLKQMGISFETFEKQIKSMMDFVDFKKEEDIVKWSYRQAKKILNFDLKVSTDIVLTTPLHERYVYREQDNESFVEYHLKYENRSDKRIEMDMEVFVAHVNSLDLNTPVNYMKMNAKHYHLFFLPGESKQIEGTLLCSKMESDLFGETRLREENKVVIVYPGVGTDDAIYSCDYPDVAVDKNHTEKVAGLYAASYDRSKYLGFQSFYTAFINTYLLDDRDLIKGVGEVNQEYPDEIDYISPFQFLEGTRTIVTENADHKITMANICFPNYYPNSEKVLTTYQLLRDELIKISLKNGKFEEGKIGEGNWANYSGELCDIYLQTIKNDQNQMYSIKISIFFD